MNNEFQLSKHPHYMISWEQIIANGMSILAIAFGYWLVEVKEFIQIILTFLVAAVGLAYNMERWLYYREERKEKRREREEKSKEK